jgi:hypothetical protein
MGKNCFPVLCKRKKILLFEQIVEHIFSMRLKLDVV